MTRKREDNVKGSGEKGTEGQQALAVQGEAVAGMAIQKDGAAGSSARLAQIRQTFEEEKEIRKLVQEYVNESMTEGIDYGVIPGTGRDDEKENKDPKKLKMPRKTLLKPGAEKIVAIFHCTPAFKVVHREERFGVDPFFNYMFRVQLLSPEGKIVAEGFGSANSHESKYRYRNARMKCPFCHKETVIKGKAEYGGGWLCWQSKGGCGQKWPDGAKEIEGQELGKLPNEDVATLANTILKMAKKRALVDGALALGRCSDMFTQDEEDEIEEQQAGKNQQQRQGNAQPAPATGQQTASSRTDQVAEKAKAKAASGRPGNGNGSAPASSSAPTGAGPVMKFGKKDGIFGRLIKDLDDATIAAQIKDGEDWLNATTTQNGVTVENKASKYAPDVQTSVRDLKEEQARRKPAQPASPPPPDAAPPGGEPPPPPANDPPPPGDDDAPFTP